MSSRRSRGTRFGIFFAFALAPALTLGCTGGSADGPSGPVSFKNDLLVHPGKTDITFEFSCGLSSSCHQGTVRNPQTERVFLGCNTANPGCSATEPVAEQVYKGLVGNPDAGMLVMSQELRSMAYVQPGDPDHSYLVRKLEGTLSDLQSQCVPVAMDPIVATATGDPPPLQPCGVQMPLGSPPVPDFAAKVRLWIAQGAPDN